MRYTVPSVLAFTSFLGSAITDQSHQSGRTRNGAQVSTSNSNAISSVETAIETSTHVARDVSSLLLPPSVADPDFHDDVPALTMEYPSSTASTKHGGFETPYEGEIASRETGGIGNRSKTGSTPRERPESKGGKKKKTLLWDNAGFAAAAFVGAAGWLAQPQLVGWMRRDEPGQRN
jgi:hypothetical protein